MRVERHILSLVGSLLLATGTVHAHLSFVLTPAEQSGTSSNEVVFTGTLANTSLTGRVLKKSFWAENLCAFLRKLGGDFFGKGVFHQPASNLFLNDIRISFTCAATNYLAADTNVFFANVPGILLPGETYSDVVFAVVISPGTPRGDYFGSVTLLGGSNIFAATTLASQCFHLSTPGLGAISILATAPDAYKLGALPGAFAISRSGATHADLAVSYFIGGTASNGFNYSALSNSVVIPAGLASATISVTPLADNAVGGDLTVVLTLSSSTTDSLGTPVSATVTIHDTPFNTWRLAEFGTNANNEAISGDLADPDGDGIVNLLEYALHLNPNVPDASGLPTPQLDPTCGCLRLTYTRLIAATDLTYTPETASGPSGPWSTNGITQTVIAADGVTQTIQASDLAHPIATASNRFMHLKVTRQP